MFLEQLADEAEGIVIADEQDPFDGTEVLETQHAIGVMTDPAKVLLVLRERYSETVKEASRALRRGRIDAEEDESLIDEVKRLGERYSLAQQLYEVADAAFWAEVLSTMREVFQHENLLVLPGWQIGYQDKGEPTEGVFIVGR